MKASVVCLETLLLWMMMAVWPFEGDNTAIVINICQCQFNLIIWYHGNNDWQMKITLCGRLSQSRIRRGGRMSEKPLVSEILPRPRNCSFLFKTTMAPTVKIYNNLNNKIIVIQKWNGKLRNLEKTFRFTLTSLNEVTFVSWLLQKRCLCVLWKRLDLACRLCGASLDLKAWRNVWAFIIQTTVNVWPNKRLKSIPLVPRKSF